MEFPRLRLQQAGANAEELAALELEFDALPAAQQLSQLDRWAGVSNAELSEWIEAWRGRESVPEPEEQAPAPTPSTSPSSSASSKGSSPSDPAASA